MGIPPNKTLIGTAEAIQVYRSGNSTGKSPRSGTKNNVMCSMKVQDKVTGLHFAGWLKCDTQIAQRMKNLHAGIIP
jgi:hypothetical protein